MICARTIDRSMVLDSGVSVVATQNQQVSRIVILFFFPFFKPTQMVSLLRGQELSGGSSLPLQEAVDTVNALGVKNGSQILATPEQVQELKDHIRTFQSPYTDLRPQIRRIEQDIFTNHSGFLIGNQCMDFQKQDGITEIEEAIMANTIERRLNDLLLADEADGVVSINRKPIYVSCVSNFTNFLDLSRKTIRSLEVGIPCVILGRSNTSQHPYRWTQLLVKLLAEHNVDPGMLTFMSCSLADIQDVTVSCADSTGNLYTTCSRELAATIKSTYPNTVASTGGPNTLVATEFTPEIAEAICTSATIESSGQCTALRMAVVPVSVSHDDVKGVFDRVEQIAAAPEAVHKSVFAGVFAQHTGSVEPDQPKYNTHETVDAFWRIMDNDLPAPGINEFWRKVAVDFSRMDLQDESSVARLADWLNENQPISLAVNGPRQQAIKLGLSLFEKTGMVVYTVGSSDDANMTPALTCQARYVLVPVSIYLCVFLSICVSICVTLERCLKRVFLPFLRFILLTPIFRSVFIQDRKREKSLGNSHRGVSSTSLPSSQWLFPARIRHMIQNTWRVICSLKPSASTWGKVQKSCCSKSKMIRSAVSASF
jgi:hypothetical protein